MATIKSILTSKVTENFGRIPMGAQRVIDDATEAILDEIVRAWEDSGHDADATIAALRYPGSAPTASAFKERVLDLLAQIEDAVKRA